MIDSPSASPALRACPPRRRLPRATAYLLPLLLAASITLALRGYNFGGGNHTVYLIAPLQDVHPELLRNDWWTTHTLQYHVAHNLLTAAFMRLGVLEPAYLALYLALVLLLHAAWLRIVLSLGLTVHHYLLSVLLYYLSAGGTGLGSYMFLQDSAFLPGNVANVALLWALVFWIERRTWPAAACFALASLFHLNHALIALAFWPTAYLYELWQERPHRRWHGRPARDSFREQFLPFALILFFALPNLIPAVKLTLAHLPKLSLKDFVDLYVHLRHPHHYDPLAWPAALWLSFLWPIPLAILAYRRLRPDSAFIIRNSAFVFLFFSALLLIAFVFAGVFFVSEPLIQMSLFRFSIYPKLLSCVGAAAWILSFHRPGRRRLRLLLLALPLLPLAALYVVHKTRLSPTASVFIEDNASSLLFLIAVIAAASAFVGLGIPRRRDAQPASFRAGAEASLAILVLSAVLFAGWHKWLGLTVRTHDANEASYRALCEWARDHTPTDAVFLVPPNEQLFRYHARRAIVVNFKNVPQLSSEMREWKERLEAVLDQPLATLPKRFDLAHAAIASRYDALPADHLLAVARRYGARYVVTATPLPRRQTVFENASYHLYDLAP